MLGLEANFIHLPVPKDGRDTTDEEQGKKHRSDMLLERRPSSACGYWARYVSVLCHFQLTPIPRKRLPNTMLSLSGCLLGSPGNAISCLR